MEIFDNYYRPDTPSQRYRLLAVTIPGLLVGILPWVKPLRLWLAGKSVARSLASVLATILHLADSRPPYPSAQWLVQVLLVVVAVSAVLSGVKLQISVLRGFAPGSRMLQLAQKLLLAEGLVLLSLIFTWPSH